MGVLLLMVVLVVGFLYTNVHPVSRYKQMRSTGWNAYFHVASWGLFFTLVGCIASLVLMYSLDLISLIFRIPSIIFTSLDYSVPLFGRSIFQHHLPGGFAVGTLLSFVLAALIAFGKALQSKNLMKSSPKDQEEEYRKVAESDGLEALLFDSMRQNLLVLISLKSRKAYVGKVQQTRFVHADLENIVIIPMLSGYRDKDTLTFVSVHSYTEYYREHVISQVSEPLTINDFRTVIPRNEIESASLFDPETFKKFNELESK
jgi:hypothetical protein